jgi:hypothetical protein
LYRRLEWGALGLEAFQFFDGQDLIAAGVVDAALKAALGFGCVEERLGGEGLGWGRPGVVDRVNGDPGVKHFSIKHLSINSGEAAEEPGVVDDVVDQESLDEGLRLAIVVELSGKGDEGSGILAGDDEKRGVDWGLESILTGRGLALDGARACGFLGVTAVSVYLTTCGHFPDSLMLAGQAGTFVGNPDCGPLRLPYYAQGKPATWGWRGGLAVSG